MENHPIPQDVTGFQFKLIGNMTVKQFSYLATGIVLAWVILQLPIPFLIKFPISSVFAILGISLAYLPIEGRPMDAMIGHFIKALISPTQFVYQKQGGHLYYPNIHFIQLQNTKQSINQESGKRLKAYLSSLPKHPHSKLDEQEANFLSNLFKAASKSSKPQPQQGKINQTIVAKSGPIPAHHANNQQPNPQKQIHHVTTQPQVSQKPPESPKPHEPPKKETPKPQEASQKLPEDSSIHKKLSELERILQEERLQKEKMAQEISDLKQKLEAKSVFEPGTASSIKETKNVLKIPQDMSKNIGLPNMPNVPNLITGIVKDSRGNPLNNILIEVKDTQGHPVRAFKTNPLGRFLAATPLTNGVYTIEFEDPKGVHTFDAIEITIKGEVVAPLEIKSIDERELLRKSLFGDRK